MRSHVLSATSSRALVVGDTASGLSALPAAQKEARRRRGGLARQRVRGRAAHRRERHQGRPGPLRHVLPRRAPRRSRGLRVAARRRHGRHGDRHGARQRDVPHGRRDRARCGRCPSSSSSTAATSGRWAPPVRRAPSAGWPERPGRVGQSGSHRHRAATGNYHRLAASFATELIDIGVRAVVACGWAVDDGAASTFATTFYDRMLVGPDLRRGDRRRPLADVERPPVGQHLGCLPVLRRPGVPARPRRRRAPRRRPRAAAPASAEQARVEIENLSQSVDISRNTRFGLDRLRELYEALAAGGPRGRRAPGAHRPHLQQVRRLRRTPRSTSSRPSSAAGTALTVRDFEVWIDQVVRAAATRHRHASTTRSPRSSRPSTGCAPSSTTPRPLVLGRARAGAGGASSRE